MVYHHASMTDQGQGDLLNTLTVMEFIILKKLWEKNHVQKP